MNNLSKTAKEVRREILKMHFNSQESHIGSSFSCSDILTVLYFKIMKIDPKNPRAKNRDRFILSKSHAVSALYAVLALKGFFKKNILKTFCCDKSCLPGHCTIKTVPGVEASTGSLGHALSLGTGMALALKRDKKNQRVFVLISDGECDEGANWEAALFASHHKLGNLTAIIDYNKLQAFGRTNEVLNLEPLKAKWQNFGWGVKEIDGHNLSKIEESLKKIPFEAGKPSMLICHTVKGKGVSFMEDKLEWHYKSPNKEQYELALKELS